MPSGEAVLRCKPTFRTEVPLAPNPCSVRPPEGSKSSPSLGEVLRVRAPSPRLKAGHLGGASSSGLTAGPRRMEDSRPVLAEQGSSKEGSGVMGCLRDAVARLRGMNQL